MAKSRGVQLIEEGAAFLGSCDSGEPVRLVGADLGGQRLFEQKFGREERSPRPHHASKLAEDRVASGVEIEDAVHECDINRPRRNRKAFLVRPAEGGVTDSGAGRAHTCPVEHRATEIGADHETRRRPSRGDQSVQPSTTPG